MAYTKTNWQNSPSTGTPINAENLNHIEQGIKDLDDNKLDITGNAASATKLATPRNINGVAFDGSGDIDTPSMYETETQSQILSASGWYRFAKTRSTLHSIENVIFNLSRDYNSNNSENYLIALSFARANPVFVQLVGSVNENLLTKVRFVYKNGSESYLEVYYNASTSNSTKTQIINSLNKDFENVNFTAGEIPTGYTSTEFTLSANPIKASAAEFTGEITASGVICKKQGTSQINSQVYNNNNKVYMNECGGDYRGAVLDITECANYAASKLLHTGNSAPVVISATAPSDTSSLWIDNVNMVQKIYKNGAWTALS